MPLAKSVLSMKPKTVGARSAACQQVVLQGADIDLNRLPVQTCWPGEPAPLITWPLVVTKGPSDSREDNFNLGIYRMQVLSRNQTIMRWLRHRGGAQQHRRWSEKKAAAPLPAAAVIGADPGTIIAAVTPVPDTLSEYQFAGLLRGARVELTDCVTQPLKVPAEAEIVIEGEVSLSDYRDEGPYGDHTGYYNAVEQFPVFTATAITMRKDPIYLSTFTGRPPDEPSRLGEALNEVFIPLFQQQFPEIVDFWLPPEGCSYRIAVVSIRKAYPGHAKRVMMAVWSYLRQFMYTKWVIVVDDDIDARDWKDVMWAIATRMDPARDITLIEGTPIDYLDFASPQSGLGSKIGLDATNKWPPEVSREWGREIRMSDDIVKTVTEKWPAPRPSGLRRTHLEIKSKLIAGREYYASALFLRDTIAGFTGCFNLLLKPDFSLGGAHARDPSLSPARHTSAVGGERRARRCRCRVRPAQNAHFPRREARRRGTANDHRDDQ